MDRFDFRIGARVHLQDGPGGLLQKVVVDPHTRRVTDLVIEKGFLQKKDRVIPVTLVEMVTPEEITLTLYSRQLRHYPEFQEEAFTEPVDGWDARFHYSYDQVFHWLPDYGLYEDPEMYMPMLQRRVHKGIRSNHEVIGRSTLVRNRRGIVGKVDHLLANWYTKNIEHLVVRKGFLPYRLIIPASWIEEVNVNGVFICGDDADVEELPAHRARSAADTLAELQDRLSTARFDFSGVAASLENGVLCLRGFVKDSAAKLRAQAIGFSVEGVIQVENLLETNLTITDRVKEALESDPRTREPFIEVAHDRGIVTLSGKVSSPATRGAAEEITANLPGVISVVNALEVLDDHPRPKPDSDAAAVLKG